MRFRRFWLGFPLGPFWGGMSWGRGYGYGLGYNQPKIKVIKRVGPKLGGEVWAVALAVLLLIALVVEYWWVFLLLALVLGGGSLLAQRYGTPWHPRYPDPEVPTDSES